MIKIHENFQKLLLAILLLSFIGIAVTDFYSKNLLAKAERMELEAKKVVPEESTEEHYVKAYTAPVEVLLKARLSPYHTLLLTGWC